MADESWKLSKNPKYNIKPTKEPLISTPTDVSTTVILPGRGSQTTHKKIVSEAEKAAAAEARAGAAAKIQSLRDKIGEDASLKVSAYSQLLPQMDLTLSLTQYVPENPVMATGKNIGNQLTPFESPERAKFRSAMTDLVQTYARAKQGSRMSDKDIEFNQIILDKSGKGRAPTETVLKQKRAMVGTEKLVLFNDIIRKDRAKLNETDIRDLGYVLEIPTKVVEKSIKFPRPYVPTPEEATPEATSSPESTAGVGKTTPPSPKLIDGKYMKTQVHPASGKRRGLLPSGQWEMIK